MVSSPFFGEKFHYFGAINKLKKRNIQLSLPATDLLRFLVIPVGEGKDQIMKKIIKLAANEYKTEDLGQFRFVPLLKEKGRD